MMINKADLEGKGSIEVIFFDAGETLIHPYPSYTELFHRTCWEHGFEADKEAIPFATRELLHGIEERQKRGFTFSTSEEKSRGFWLKFYGDLLEKLGHYPDSRLAEALYQVFSHPGNYSIYEDAADALAELERKGIKLGLISNFEPWLKSLLVDLGIFHYFDHVYISGIVGVEKPHPRIFQMALEGAGVEPRSAMHVGDSPLSDVEGARDSGMIPVLVDRHGRYPHMDCLRVCDLRELPALLDGEWGLNWKNFS